MEENEVFEELKKEVDSMTRKQMCRIWRFGNGRPEFTDGGNPISQYFSDRLFKHFGGFTPEISKELGWQNNTIKNKKT